MKQNIKEELMNSKNSFAKIVDFNVSEDFEICRAKKYDVENIIKIAASVGKNINNSKQGYLMNDYSQNTEKHIKKFEKDVENSKFFYIIKRRNNVLGFLLAYQKNQWLDIEPQWIFNTNWKGDFNKNSLKNFIILEKIAVKSNLTGQGIGSELFKQFRQDALSMGIKNMFSETILSPKPNFASMEFAMKQRYKLAGIRYEEFNENLLTTIVYHRKLQ